MRRTENNRRSVEDINQITTNIGESTVVDSRISSALEHSYAVLLVIMSDLARIVNEYRHNWV